MPVKRRTSKATMKPEAEALIWGDLFDGGAFLLAGEPEALGLDPDDEGAILEAAAEAWARLGRLYLDTGIGRREGVTWCGSGAWALEAFGAPPEG